MINSYAIAGREIEVINFPDSVEKIGSYNGYWDSNLKTININRSEEAVSGSPWGATNATVNWTSTE